MLYCRNSNVLVRFACLVTPECTLGLVLYCNLCNVCILLFCICEFEKIQKTLGLKDEDVFVTWEYAGRQGAAPWACTIDSCLQGDISSAEHRTVIHFTFILYDTETFRGDIEWAGLPWLIDVPGVCFLFLSFAVCECPWSTFLNVPLWFLSYKIVVVRAGGMV